MKHIIVAVLMATASAGVQLAHGQEQPGSPAEPYHPKITTIGSRETPESLARFYARDPALFNLEDAYLEWPLPPSEKRYGAIDGRRIKRMAVDLVEIARREKQRSPYWGRITGTEADRETRRYVEAKFHELGLSKVNIQEIGMPLVWWPRSWSVTFADEARTTQTLPSAFPLGRSMGTGTEGLTAPVVWLGLGTAADFQGRDVNGKIALLFSAPEPNVHGQTAVFEQATTRAQKAGAAAVLIALDIPGNVTSQMARTGDITIPGLTIGHDDGVRLRHAIESGTAPVVTLKLAVEMVSGINAANVWGVLPGMTDENVLITAHTDSYFDGAVDNASGVANMLELARYFASIPLTERRRTITFVATGGHHEGSPGTHYIHDQMQPFLAKTALIINSEHTAVNDYTVWGQPPDVRLSTQTSGQTLFTLKGSERMKKIVLSALKTFGVGVLERPEARANGDVASLFADAPTVQLIDVPLQYHTDADTPDLLPWPGLANAARADAKIIAELDKIPLADIRGDRGGAPVTQ
ncbi:MAG: M28 family metallopeptidase [Pseudomonadota bacterium]|nr:M28 family metallopeptidase [Pseudomonadota bacterium]